MKPKNIKFNILVDNTSIPYKLSVLIFLSMLYITCKLSCNPIFFRQTDFNFPFINYHFRFTCAAFIFPAIYVINDAIVAFTNRRIALVIIVVGIACDGLFSYLISYFSSLGLPKLMSETEALNNSSVNIIGLQMWPLFYHGLVATIIAAVSETLIFSFIYKKINSFFISTNLSICIILVMHNLITDYSSLRHELDAWRIIIDNWLVNMSFVLFYTFIVVGVIKIRKYILKTNLGEIE